MSRRTVALSVDMDAPENYAEFYRRPKDEALPLGAFYERALPRLLDLLDALGIRGTFFCIGEHAERPEGRAAVRAVAARGHEIANHTHTHPIAFRRLSRDGKRREIQRAHDVLTDLVEEGRVVGFRSPAYDVDRDAFEILHDLGYVYDASVLPSPWIQAAKLVVRWRSRRWWVGLGSWRQGFRTRRPHALDFGSPRARLVELPLTVLSPWRFPFYGSFTQKLGLDWFRRGLARLTAEGRPIHYSIHLQELAETPQGVPAYDKPPETRIEILSRSLTLLAEGSDCIPLGELAGTIGSP